MVLLRGPPQFSSMYTISRSGLPLGVRVSRGPSTTTHYVVVFKNILHARHVQYNLHPEPSIWLLRDPKTDIDMTERFLPMPKFLPMNVRTQHIDDLDDLGDVGDIGARVVMNNNALVNFPRMDTHRYPGYAGFHPMNDGGFNLDVVNESDILTLPFRDRDKGVILPFAIVVDDGATSISMHCHVIDPYSPR